MGRAAPHSRGPVASRKRDKRNSAPVGAPPTPLRVGREWIETNPGATTRRGNEQHWLFDIVKTATANGSLRAPRLRTRRAPAHSRVPAERASASEEPGPRGYMAKSRGYRNRPSCALGPGSRFARPGHEVSARFRACTAAAHFGETNPRCKIATAVIAARGDDPHYGLIGVSGRYPGR